MNRCLGKRARVIDPRAPLLATLAIASPLPAAPASIDLPNVKAWSALGNDQIGDCTIAAALHLVQAWRAANNNVVVPSTDAAIAVYSAATGYKPGDAATDQGGIEIDILKFWMMTGMAVNDTEPEDTIDGFAVIEHSNTDLVKRAIAAFGGVYAGIAMPLSAQNQSVWDVPAGGANNDAAPGSWGGHAVPLLGYDDTGPIVISWGQPFRMTWAFWETYADEAYAVLSWDWMASRRSPAGLSWRSLVADMKALSAQMRSV